MAGLEGEGHSRDAQSPDAQSWDEHSHWEDVQHDRRFLNENCPRDPMILALPLMELRNLAIDPQLARAMQRLYEDMARRYLEMADLLRVHAAQRRRPAGPEDEPRDRPGKRHEGP